MAIANFNLTKPLEKIVNNAIKERGFASKAEFFRFAIMQYAETKDNDISDEEYRAAINDLKSALHKKFKNKTLPSIEEQFADMM